ncbi:MAG TPA: PIG-L deacetylase family protein [Acidobacteriota bacterium]|nr:PIG-L deacetylase family protein [Acidobacteriota bacterium]
MQQRNNRILAVGAHPDDVEFMCAGTLYLLRQLGYEIHVASMSLGDCGSLEYAADELKQIRGREAEAACTVLGATFHYVGFSDFCIYNDDASNRKTTALLRQINPLAVFTHPAHDYLSDHEATSLLVRNACFYAPVPNYDTGEWSRSGRTAAIPSLFYTQPLEGKDIFGKPVAPQFYVDISDCVELKQQMLACHKSQRDWLRAHHGIDEYIDSMRRWSTTLAEQASKVAVKPVQFAEAFRQHVGHAYPQANFLAEALGIRVIEDNRS